MDENNERETAEEFAEIEDPAEKAAKARKRKKLLIFALALGIVIPALLIVLGIGIDGAGFFPIFLIFALLFLAAGIVTFVVYCRMGRAESDGEKPVRKSATPYVALAVELCAAPLFFLAFAMGVAGIFVAFVALLLPLVGIILGIVALNLDKEYVGRVGKTFALIAIFLPIATILVFILLFSTGVLRIALM